MHTGNNPNNEQNETQITPQQLQELAQEYIQQIQAAQIYAPQSTQHIVSNTISKITAQLHATQAQLRSIYPQLTSLQSQNINTQQFETRYEQHRRQYLLYLQQIKQLQTYLQQQIKQNDDTSKPLEHKTNAMDNDNNKCGMALQHIDNLLNVFDNTVAKKLEKDKCVENVFTSSRIAMSTYHKIWTYLLNEAPLNDNLVITSTLFRDITYNHHLFVSSFHIRLDPSFIFSKHNHNQFQIGSNTSQAAKKSVIINNVETIISNKHKLKFPFHSLKIFEIAKICTKYQVIPFFNEFSKSIKCLSWSIHNFEKRSYKSREEENDKSENEICIFPQCQLFAIATDGVWSDSIELNDKFPSLYWFTFFLDDTRTKWDQNIFDKLQLFLFSHEETLSIFVLDLNLKAISVNNDIYNKDNPFTLVLPENIEILVLKCMNRERNEMFRFDFSFCRHKIKQIVLLNNSLVYVKALLMDGRGAHNLQYFVVNDREDVNELSNLLENVNLFQNTKINTIYTPCIPKFAFSNVKLENKANDIQFIDSFPDLEAVKDIIENQNVRKLFRDLNCKERRHWLWCIFWFDVQGKGIRKLRQLEAKWKLDMIDES